MPAHGPTLLRSFICLLGVLLTALPARPVAACGPGVHMREAERLLALLSVDEPAWAERAALPLALAYLRLGSISPDLQWPIDSLPFGHGPDLSNHLVAAAEQRGPLEQLFALGHLAHNASDPACEMFFTPALFASAAIGMVDLYEGDDDAAGEAETLTEGFGDILVGNWEGVIDTLYDFWLDGGAARADLDALLQWYCAEGAAFTGTPTDCAQVQADVHALLASAEERLGGTTRAYLKQVVRNIQNSPPDQVLSAFELLLAQLLPGGWVSQSAHYDAEVARLRTTPLMDRETWRLYDDHVAELGPHIGRDRYLRRPAIGWPGYNPLAQVCGNVQSAMRFLPEGEEGVVPGLIVDGLEWRNAGGAGVGTAEPGGDYALWVRFYAALPFAGPIRVVVRSDRPGAETAPADIVAETTFDVDIDPLAVETNPRIEVVLPFTATVGEALGYTAELYAEPRQNPWFTTSWDRLWTAPGLPVDWALYRENFGTYGHWPPSLRAADRNEGALFAKVQLAPAGPPLAGATVDLGAGVVPALSAQNGVAWFDALPPGSYEVAAALPGYAAGGPQPVALAAQQQAWVWLPLHAVPVVTSDAPYSPSNACVPIHWNAGAFADQAAEFWAQPLDDASEAALSEPTALGLSGTADACFAPQPDGRRLRIQVQAEYGDGTLGVPGVSEPIVLDGSAPEVRDVALTPRADVACAPVAPYAPALDVRLTVVEPHTAVSATVRWRTDDGAYETTNAALEPLPDEPGAASLAFTLPADETGASARVQFEVGNVAGARAESAPAARPVWGAAELCGGSHEPGPEAGDDAAAEPGDGDAATAGDAQTAESAGADGAAAGDGDAGAALPDGAGPDAPPGQGDTASVPGGSGGGCRLAGSPVPAGFGAALPALLLLAGLGLGRRARRSR